MIGAVCDLETCCKPTPISQPNTVPVGMGPVGIGTLGSMPGRFLMIGAGAIIPHSLGMAGAASTHTVVASAGVVSVAVVSVGVAFTLAAASMAAVAVTVAEPCL